MKPRTIRMLKRGLIVIPKPIRDELELEPDQRLTVELKNGKITITPVALPTCALEDPSE